MELGKFASNGNDSFFSTLEGAREITSPDANHWVRIPLACIYLLPFEPKSGPKETRPVPKVLYFVYRFDAMLNLREIDLESLEAIDSFHRLVAAFSFPLAPCSFAAVILRVTNLCGFCETSHEIYMYHSRLTI